ncbi:membrane-associated protein, putative, partial [Bodo saltans]
MFIAFLLIALLACCSPTSGEVWEDVQVSCESLWSAATSIITTWQPNRRYTVTNCPVNITLPSSPIFTVVIPTLTSNTSTHTTCSSNNENVAYFGNIAVTVRGGSVAPRFVLPSSSVPTSQQIHVVNVSMVLDGVNVRLKGSLSPDGAPLGGMDALRAGGLLMAIIAHSWWNVTLQIRHSVMTVTPGWIFNWTQGDSVTKRIAGLVALSIIPSSPLGGACYRSSGGAYLVVSNSSVNMTGVIGVSVLFHIDLTSGSSTSAGAAVHNVNFQIEKASRVVFEFFSNEADMCTTLTTDLKLRLSEQFIFLVSGVGDSDYDLGEGTTVTNVSCVITSSTVSIAYNPDKRCRGYRSRMDAGVAHLRGHGIVRAVSFLLSSNAPHSLVVVAPLPVPTPTTVVVRDSWSRAFVFGISLANTTTDVAVNATGTQTECTVVASDYAAYFMLFSIAVLLRSSINLSDANITTIATGGTGMLGRVAGVIVLEYVNSTINTQTSLTSLQASVQSQPGSGTGLMATSTSMFYVKGGMMDCNTSLRDCSFVGNAVGGVLQGPPLLMVTISVVTYLPVAKEFNITNTTLLLLNCSMTSMVAVNAISTFMIVASAALVVAPILTISSTIEVAQCTATIAALEIQGTVQLKRSALGAMLSSTPIPSEAMLALVTASSGYGPEQSNLIELLRLSPYRNVTVIVTQTNLRTVPDAFSLSTSSGFEGAFVIVLPRTLINDSSILLSECSFQNPSRSTNHEQQSTGVAFFLSAIVGAVGPSIINNSVVSATSMTTFAHGMTTGEGELVFGVGAMIMLSELDVQSYANDAPSARELHQSPLVALQPITSVFIPLTVTNMVVQPGSCIVVHDSTFRGFQNLTTNVLFPAPTSLTNASLRGLSSWVAPLTMEYCGGGSSVDMRMLLSCVMWSYPSTAHDGSSTP